MSSEKFAHDLVEELKKEPTSEKIYEVVDRIKKFSDHENVILNEILYLMENELGDYGFLLESYDNQAMVTVMSEIRKIIAQANSEGNKK